MNNVHVYHRDHTISIAQHNIVGMRVQEIMVWGPNVDDEIIQYGNAATSLAEALAKAILLIDNRVDGDVE